MGHMIVGGRVPRSGLVASGADSDFQAARAQSPLQSADHFVEVPNITPARAYVGANQIQQNLAEINEEYIDFKVILNMLMEASSRKSILS
jgi:hypothetical protein